MGVGFSGQLDPAGMLDGGTDGTRIGNTGDRLNTNAIINPTLTNVVAYEVNPLTNASSQDMDVNGSSTPVNFDWTATTNTYFLRSVSITLSDSAINPVSGFGALGTLANGIQFIIKQAGTERVVSLINTNADLFNTFSEHSFFYDNSGLLGGAQLFSGEILFEPPLLMAPGTSDFVRMRVRDNLSALDIFRARVKVWRVLS